MAALNFRNTLFGLDESHRRFPLREATSYRLLKGFAGAFSSAEALQ